MGRMPCGVVVTSALLTSRLSYMPRLVHLFVCIATFSSDDDQGEAEMS